MFYLHRESVCYCRIVENRVGLSKNFCNSPDEIVHERITLEKYLFFLFNTHLLCWVLEDSKLLVATVWCTENKHLLGRVSFYKPWDFTRQKVRTNFFRDSGGGSSNHASWVACLEMQLCE